MTFFFRNYQEKEILIRQQEKYELKIIGQQGKEEQERQIQKEKNKKG